MRTRRCRTCWKLALAAAIAYGAAHASVAAEARTIAPAAVLEAPRQIPVAYDVDVVVVGGSSGGVAAAAEAARMGARVFLAAPRPYLGDDLCTTLRLWLEEGETPQSELAKAMFSEGNPAKPMHVKRVLDDALLSTGVQYLFGCFATDLLVDAQGKPAGVVMANRAGRQAVRAKVIVDATERATVARLAGGQFVPYPAGPQVFRRVVVGGLARKADGKGQEVVPLVPREGQGVASRFVAAMTKPAWQPYRLLEYALTVPLRDASFAAFAEAEQIARDCTFDPHQVDASAFLFHVPPDPMKGRRTLAGAWPGAEEADVEVFRPAGVDRLYVLGGCADVSRQAAERLLRPLPLIDMGTRVGRAAAAEAKQLPASEGVRVANGPTTKAATIGEVRELLQGVRPTDRELPTVASPERALPVLGAYDVVVIGGGTSGAPAAIGAARQGAKTLLVEYQHELGGIGTLGLIGNYWGARPWGFCVEHDQDVAQLNATVHVVGKTECWRRTCRQSGAEIWLGAIGCGTLLDGGKVKGVAVATPAGRGVVLAATVVDATGSGDAAIAAGAPYEYVGPESMAVQGAGLAARDLGTSYANTDHTFTDDSDLVDVWRTFVYSRLKFPTSYDHVPIVQTRERRRIVGDYVLMPLDLLNRRTFPDSVHRADGIADTHGFMDSPTFLMNTGWGGSGWVPYRCLLPRGLDGILVTGLATSVHRDVTAGIRMQPSLQNLGYATGVAAAMAAKTGGSTRAVDVKNLQEHLVEKGNLPERVLTDKDSFPLSADKVATAVKGLAGASWKPYRNPNRPNYALETQHLPGVEVVLAEPQQALPLLREACRTAEPEAVRLVYAQVLAILGDATGTESLVAAVKSSGWDGGWNYTGMGQFGPALSRMDTYVIALGLTRDRRALPPILEKLAALGDDPFFSHCRAVAIALTALKDPAAAKPLAELLRKPGMGGHAVTSAAQLRENATPDRSDTTARNRALREIVIAGALYRCGDHERFGQKTLEQYALDLHGVYARHAQAVLKEGPQSKPR